MGQSQSQKRGEDGSERGNEPIVINQVSSSERLIVDPGFEKESHRLDLDAQKQRSKRVEDKLEDLGFPPEVQSSE
jgi:hypothetical protein